MKTNGGIDSERLDEMERITVMKAGRDLDCLVCEKVFDNKTFGSVKPYSTDISAALLVVEELDNSDFVMRRLVVDNGRFWRVTIKEVCITVRSAPEAICKAVLLEKLRMSYDSNKGE